MRSTSLRSGDAQAGGDGVTITGGRRGGEAATSGLVTTASATQYASDVVGGWIAESNWLDDGFSGLLMASNITSVGVGVAIADNGSTYAVADTKV